MLTKATVIPIYTEQGDYILKFVVNTNGFSTGRS